MAHLEHHISSKSSELDMAYLQLGNAYNKLPGQDCKEQLQRAISSFEALGANRELRVARGLLSRTSGSL